MKKLRKDRKVRLYLNLGGAVLLTSLVAGCTTSMSHPATSQNNIPKSGGNITNSSSRGKPNHPVTSTDASKALEQTLGASTSWPWFGNNAWQDRFSPLRNLSGESAHLLHLVFHVPLPASGSNESFPIERNGILYATSGHGNVVALNAATGSRLWSYTNSRTIPSWMPTINRGVAVGKHHVYVLTPDDYLVALDASTGQQQYAVSVASQAQGNFESMAPLLVNGTVVVGSAGGDEGIRGFVEGYDAATGKRLWKFYTVPLRGQSWMSATGSHGGGTVWTTPAYDPTSGSIYFGTGNPSPDYYGKTRPGPDP